MPIKQLVEAFLLLEKYFSKALLMDDTYYYYVYLPLDVPVTQKDMARLEDLGWYYDQEAPVEEEQQGFYAVK